MNTAETLSKKIEFAFDESGIDRATVARECDVTRQSVDSWLRTGRIGKNHLPKLAELTDFPLAWWLDDSAPLKKPGAEAARRVTDYADAATKQVSELFFSLEPTAKIMALALLKVVQTHTDIKSKAPIREIRGEVLSQKVNPINQGRRSSDQNNQHHRVPKQGRNRST